MIVFVMALLLWTTGLIEVVRTVFWLVSKLTSLSIVGNFLVLLFPALIVVSVVYDEFIIRFCVLT